MKLPIRSILAMLCILASLNALGSTTTLGKQLETYSVKVANQKYDGLPPTASQMESLSSRIVAYAKAAQADGTLQAAEAAFLKGKTKFINSELNSTSIYSNLKSSGWKGTLQEVQGWTEQSDVAGRKALVNKVQTEGLYKMLAVDFAGAIGQVEKQLASNLHKPRFLNANYNGTFVQVGMNAHDCTAMNGAGLAIAAIGGVAMIIPGTEVLGGLLLASAGCFMFCVWCMCD